jgi:hypothetical protein
VSLKYKEHQILAENMELWEVGFRMADIQKQIQILFRSEFH